MDANERQISVKITSGLMGSEKLGVFPDPGIRILPKEPMVGDETSGFPEGGCLRRERSHPMKVLCCPERF